MTCTASGVTGTDSATNTTGTASDCSSVPNNVGTNTGGNIIARGDNYVDKVVKKIQASALWQNSAKKEAIVIMFDEGNDATVGDLNSCCGWKAGKAVTNNPLVQGGDGGTGWTPDTSNANYNKGNKGSRQEHLRGADQPAGSAPKGVSDSDVYSHFSFVRTLQDMFGLSDPTNDASYFNRAKYTEEVRRPEPPEPARVHRQRRHALRLGAPDEPRLRDPRELHGEDDGRRHALRAGRARREPDEHLGYEVSSQVVPGKRLACLLFVASGALSACTSASRSAHPGAADGGTAASAPGTTGLRVGGDRHAVHGRRPSAGRSSDPQLSASGADHRARHCHDPAHAYGPPDGLAVQLGGGPAATKQAAVPSRPSGTRSTRHPTPTCSTTPTE